MKKIVLISLKILRVLLYWFWFIPIRLSLVAFIIYNLLIILVFGSIEPVVVKESLSKYGIGYGWFNLIIGIPYFLSFISIFGRWGASSDSLDDAIAHRNNMMNHVSDKEAYAIYQKTGHLDVMNSNRGDETYDQAVRGFKATHRNDAPQKIYKDLTEK